MLDSVTVNKCSDFCVVCPRWFRVEAIAMLVGHYPYVVFSSTTLNLMGCLFLARS